MMESPKTWMRKYKILTVIVASAAFFLFSFSPYAKDPELTVVTEILEPYQYFDNQQNLRGYGADVVNALMQRVGQSPQIEVSPWPRVYKKALSNKNTLIFSMARTPEREKMFHWIGELNHESFSFYALKKNKKIKPVANLKEIKNYSIVVTKDSVLDEIARNYELPKLERSADIAQGFKLLYRHRADLLLVPDSTIKQQASVLDYDYEDLVRVYNLEDVQFDFYIAINIDSDPKLVERLKNEFKWLEDNNVIQKLKAKWKF